MRFCIGPRLGDFYSFQPFPIFPGTKTFVASRSSFLGDPRKPFSVGSALSYGRPVFCAALKGDRAKRPKHRPGADGGGGSAIKGAAGRVALRRGGEVGGCATRSAARRGRFLMGNIGPIMRGACRPKRGSERHIAFLACPASKREAMCLSGSRRIIVLAYVFQQDCARAGEREYLSGPPGGGRDRGRVCAARLYRSWQDMEVLLRCSEPSRALTAGHYKSIRWPVKWRLC